MDVRSGKRDLFIPLSEGSCFVVGAEPEPNEGLDLNWGVATVVVIVVGGIGACDEGLVSADSLSICTKKP